MLSSIFNWSIAAILASFTLMPASTGRTTAPTVEPIVEEAELKGCATNFESQGLIPFYYDGPDYSKDEVEEVDNWKYGTPSPSCNNGSDLACMILADPSHVDNPANPTSLLGSVNIVATEDNGYAYVSSISGASTFQNRDL